MQVYKVMEEHPERFESVAKDPVIESEQYNHEEGMARAVTFLSKHPNDPEANYALANFLCANGDLKNSIKHFRAAVTAKPQKLSYWVAYITSLTDIQHYRGAESVLAQLKAIGGPKVEIDRLKAVIDRSKDGSVLNISAANHSSDSRRSSDDKYKPVPQHRRNIKGHGQKKLKTSDHPPQETLTRLVNLYTSKDMASLLRGANLFLTQYPRSHILYGLHGLANKALGRYEDAILSYKAALKLEPRHAETYYNLGNVYLAMESEAHAISAYKNAIQINPKHSNAYNNLANALQISGDVDASLAAYKKAISLDSGNGEAHYNVGNILSLRGDVTSAINSFKQALEINPNHAVALASLGHLLKAKGQHTDAEDCFNRAIKLQPNNPDVLTTLGNLLTEKGNEESLTYYYKALSIDPNHRAASYNLGILLMQNKSYQEAAKLLKDQDFKQSQTHYLRCLYSLGDETAFYEHLDRLISGNIRNATVGSYGLRASVKYGRVKQNLFCNDPLVHVLKVDLTQECDFNTTFVDTARSILRRTGKDFKRQDLLTNGVQTAGNLFADAKGATENIEKIIRSEIEKYRHKYRASAEGFIKHWPKKYKLFGWLLDMKSGGELAPHIHEKGWLSGSIYINVPKHLKSNEGSLVVCLDDAQSIFEADESLKKVLQVTTGDLCLFPASLLHYTVPFESKESRVVLAFDIVPA